MVCDLRAQLALLSGRLGIPDVVSSVKSMPWPDPVQRAARRTAGCLAQRLPFLAELLEPKRPEPVRKPRAPRRRKPAAGRAAPDPVAVLVATLRGPDPDAAAEAATALGAHRSARARAALLEALGNREGYFGTAVRVAAVRALAQGNGEGDDAALAGAVRDIDPDVSLAAIGALTEKGGAGAMAALREIVEDDTVFVLPATRRAAARGLAALRSAP